MRYPLKLSRQVYLPSEWLTSVWLVWGPPGARVHTPITARHEGTSTTHRLVVKHMWPTGNASINRGGVFKGDEPKSPTGYN